MLSIEKLVVDSINLEIDEFAYISLNILPILIKTRKNNVNFNVKNFLDCLEFKVIKKNATILIPAFSRDFVEKNIYNRSVTKSRTGFISNQCLIREGWWRTAHPIISYITFGNKAKQLAEYKCYSAFGKGSILEKLLEFNPAQYFIGIEPEQAYTHLHYSEQKLSVPYRFSKIFTGIYIDYDNINIMRNYEMYVKKHKNSRFDFKQGFLDVYSECMNEICTIKKLYINQNMKNIERLIDEQRY